MPLSSGSLASRRRLTWVSSWLAWNGSGTGRSGCARSAQAPGIPCGLWIGTADVNYIYHEEGTTPCHQTHIALHELAHMLLNHRGATQVWERLANLLVPM
jgi:hypothetical protein